MSIQKTRKNRSNAQFQQDIYAALQKENGLSRLELSRALKMSKSPHFLQSLNKMVRDGLLIVVKRWTLNRLRHEMTYWRVPSLDYQIFAQYQREATELEAMYIPLILEYYIEANGGLLGKHGFQSEVLYTCPYCNQASMGLFWNEGENWYDCLNCGAQEKVKSVTPITGEIPF